MSCTSASDYTEGRNSRDAEVAALRSQLQAKTEDAERWEGIARRVAAVAASAMPLAMTMAIRMGMTEMDATPEQIEKELQEAIIFYDAARKDAK